MVGYKLVKDYTKTEVMVQFLLFSRAFILRTWALTLAFIPNRKSLDVISH